MAALLEVVSVSKSFTGLRAVDGVTFSMPQGEIFAVIGPNGAGKTTLFNLISGLFPPNKGTVRLNGREIQRLSPDRICQQGLARSFQITNLFGGLSIHENLRLSLQARHPARFNAWRDIDSYPEVQAETAELLRFLGLEGIENTEGGALSYGGQRLVDLGIALGSKPQVLLLDEPLAGLAAAERDGRLLLWVTGKTPASAIAEVRRSLGRDITLELVAEKQFEEGLRAAYVDGADHAASVVGEVESEVDLDRLMQDIPEIEDLLVKADMAMYEAKDQGRNRHAFFSQSMSGRSLDRLDLEQDLRRAIDAGEFALHYQPKVDAVTGNIDGVEALLRWRHAERGWISPGVFIPLAEETGMMLALGDWVINEACRQIRDWGASGLAHLCVAVNVSTLQFSREDFVESILAAVRNNGVNPQRLELEITESLLMRNIEEVTDSLRRLRNAGLKISIDDFGTGYSSLGYLNQFPVDTLKIDRSFVKDLHLSSDDAAICAAIIAMARELNLTTVAEGVELVEQLEFLQKQGCNLIQGFLFSKPLPAAELEELVRSGRRLTIRQLALEGSA